MVSHAPSYAACLSRGQQEAQVTVDRPIRARGAQKGDDGLPNVGRERGVISDSTTCHRRVTVGAGADQDTLRRRPRVDLPNRDVVSIRAARGVKRSSRSGENARVQVFATGHMGTGAKVRHDALSGGFVHTVSVVTRGATESVIQDRRRALKENPVVARAATGSQEIVASDLRRHVYIPLP